ncbi:unnamed protein product, partial [Ectocarpus fasciculatus]
FARSWREQGTPAGRWCLSNEARHLYGYWPPQAKYDALAVVVEATAAAAAAATGTTTASRRDHPLGFHQRAPGLRASLRRVPGVAASSARRCCARRRRGA